jgi:hypothetical protein
MVLTDYPSTDAEFFKSDFYKAEVCNELRHSIPIFLINITSGTPDTVENSQLLKLYENTRIPIIFVLTHIKSLL